MRKSLLSHLFAASAGIILYEITLTRIFSVLMWYHFVSFAVALALTGMGIGSLVTAKSAGRPIGEAQFSVGKWSLFSTATCLVIYLLFVALSKFPSLGYRTLAHLHQTYYEPFSLTGSGTGAFLFFFLAALLLFSLPFVGGGAVFAISFQWGGDPHGVYFTSMAGSASGVVLYLLLVKTGSAPGLLPAASLLFLAPVLLTGSSRGKGALLLLASAVSLLGWNYVGRPADPAFVRGRFEPNIIWSRWDATSRVAVFPISEEELTRGFGEGEGFVGSPPEALGMVVDDTGYTVMFRKPEEGEEENFRRFFRFNLASLPFHLAGEGRALVIGPGGGKDIHAALSEGKFRVTAVEVNPLVLSAVQEVFGDYTGRPYSLPGVELVEAEGRVFLERSRERFRVIEMTQVFGRVPPQAGAFTMTENHLYTVEAFRRMIRHLEEGGILSVTRFSFERTGPRLLNLVRQALLDEGESSPENAMLVAGSRGVMNVLAVKGGVSREMEERFLKACREKGFSPLYFPSMKGRGRTVAGVVRGEVPAGSLGFDISPPTDDRPFFYYTVRPGDFLRGGENKGGGTEDRGVMMVRAALPPVLAVSLIAVLLASFLTSPGRFFQRLSLQAAFFLTGVAFLFAEVVLIKKFILLFGFPVYSLSCVLLSVLVFSGAGSLLSSLFNLREGFRTGISCSILVILLFFLWLGGDSFVRFLLPLPHFLRYLLSFLAAGTFAFFMGIPFPSILSLYNKKMKSPAAYPLFVNGISSVFASFAFLALSLNLGYGAVIIITGVCYAVVALLVGFVS